MVKGTVDRLLDFPRFQLRQAMDLTGCPHSGRYAQDDPACRHCNWEDPCAWLVRNGEIASLKRRRLEELEQALGSGIDYVAAEVTQWGHNSQRCRCDACRWLREARRNHREIRELSAALRWVGLRTARGPHEAPDGRPVHT